MVVVAAAVVDQGIGIAPTDMNAIIICVAGVIEYNVGACCVDIDTDEIVAVASVVCHYVGTTPTYLYATPPIAVTGIIDYSTHTCIA